MMNHHGIVMEVRLEELRGMQNSSSGRAVALDVQGNQIRVGDLVSVVRPHPCTPVEPRPCTMGERRRCTREGLRQVTVVLTKSRMCGGQRAVTQGV